MSAIRDIRLNHSARVLLDTLLPSEADPALQLSSIIDIVPRNGDLHHKKIFLTVFFLQL